MTATPSCGERVAPTVRLRWQVSACFLSLCLAGCSIGEGEGSVKTDHLSVPSCWSDAYDLKPTFFAAVPAKKTMVIRIQDGSDFTEFSDGLEVLVDDIEKVRAKLGTSLSVSLPVGVTTPGVPLTANTDPSLIHMSLYLNRSCHSQNITLYSIAGSVTFAHLFNGNRNESAAEEKLIEATFDDITFADPRDHAPGVGDPAKIENASHLHGNFRFYFQRGQPAQPFP